MFYLVKIRYYNTVTEESQTDYGIVHASDLTSAVDIAREGYNPANIESLTATPVGITDGDGDFIGISAKTYAKLGKEWTGARL